MNKMQEIAGFHEIINKYQTFILDLWGVIHDGSNLYPHSKDMLLKLSQENKKIIFLSNAPRRANNAREVLKKFGIEESILKHIHTSGEYFYQLFQTNELDGCFRNQSKKYFFIGPEKDLGIIDDLGYVMTNDLAEAAFILNTGFSFMDNEEEIIKAILESAKIINLPMMCLNPDLEVVKQDGSIYPCAGLIAKDYQKIGGEVIIQGKPFKDIYLDIIRNHNINDKSSVLCVGDNLKTDILGAKRAGFDSCLIKNGIYANDLKEKSLDVIIENNKIEDAVPNYAAEFFKF